MVDNFGHLISFIPNEGENKDFWFVQIIKRRKDNPDLPRDMKLIDSLFINGSNHLIDKREDIIEKCNLNNARAYIRLNKRNWEKVALQTLRLLAENLASGNPEGVKTAMLSACGKYHSDPDKKWIIDLDGNDVEKTQEIVDFIYNLQPIGNKVIEGIGIDTVNGKHLISLPFNLQEFKKKYPDISIQKDNPTLLYFNNET